MSRTTLLFSLLACAALLTPLAAQTTRQMPDEPSLERRRAERRAKRMERFDLNQDGQVDRAERREARAERRSTMRARFLERFDHDGDGRLDDAERAEAREVMGTRRTELMENRQVRREDRAQARQARRAKHVERLRERFDHNQDGRLDESERAEIRKLIRERRAERAADRRSESL